MRIAVAGKGGAGKTTLGATLARLAARGGRRVVCIDADSNPNLGVALGTTELPAGLPTDLVSRRLDGGPALTRALPEVLAAHAATGPDGVRLLTMGMPAHAGEGCLCSAHATINAILADSDGRTDWLTVLDLEASPEHFSRGTARHVDLMLLVTEPYYRSLETTRRMAALAAELPVRVAVVANKLQRDSDADAVAEFCDRHALALAARVPFSDGILDADRAGRPAVDHSPDDPAVVAIARLVERQLAPS